jgi:hypothetical protein
MRILVGKGATRTRRTDGMKDQAARRMMQQLAHAYERLAQRAEARGD